MDTNKLRDFGAKLADMGVSGSTLEARLKGPSHIPPNDIKEVVTGFVDAMASRKESWSLQEVYNVLHGTARFLYNGDFDSVRAKVLGRMLEGGSEEDVLKFLRKNNDHAAVDLIIDHLVAKDPEKAYQLAHGPENARVAESIVAKYRNNDAHHKLIFSCLYRLKRADDLLALAREQIQKRPGFAAEVLTQARYVGTTSLDVSAEWLLIARQELNDNRLVEAYVAVKQSYEDKASEVRKRIVDRMIRKQPETALKMFSGKGDGHRESLDKAVMLRVGKRFMQLSDPYNALTAFSYAGRDGCSPEWEKAGLMVFEDIASGKELPRCEVPCAVGNVLCTMALEYFENGGNPVVADKYLAGTRLEDTEHRDLATALLKANAASNAYEHMQAIKDKKPKDVAGIASLRELLVDKHPGVFRAHGDKDGMRMYVAKNVKGHPEWAYEWAVELKDEATVDSIRKDLISKDTKGAWRFFKDKKDAVGIGYVRAKLGEGVDASIVDTFLPESAL
ncbi:hypothetical protein HY642_04865 [Candidatus Woesearchaeota archaeon]|nr:hypothetical protein [Candidatus Woesearchaeota archaeon]